MRFSGLVVLFLCASITTQAQQDWCTLWHSPAPKLVYSDANMPRSVLTIPVVFHIVWHDSTDNISDERIMSQLKVLNTDYRKLNTDLDFVPEMFRKLSADMEIEFCLATVDPDGAPTTGITHTYTDIEDIGTKNTPGIPSFAFIKHKSLGGKDGWDNEKYLNIWIGKFLDGSGYLGQSTFPWNTEASEDGVRVDPKYVGINCIHPLKKKYSYGRTLTHEIGHYLGLLHPWENNDCGIQDQVTDTPPQKGYYLGCQNNVNDDECDSIPMTMNFMQYADDRCMALFTEGQKERVWTSINDYRPYLLNQTVPCNVMVKDSILSEANINIYPNPVSSCLILELGIAYNKEVQVQIWDIAARLIYNETMPNIAIRPIEIGYVPKGIYIMKINSGNQSFTRKIMVL